MKALIRNKGETILETYNIPCIDWNTGAPLTNDAWAGGPYHLVSNYDPADATSPVMVPRSEPEPVVEENEDNYVVIDGKKYSKAELRSLLE